MLREERQTGWTSQPNRSLTTYNVTKHGGEVDCLLAFMGPWDFIAIVKYPDKETAFRVLAEIAELEVVKTETFPAEEVELFFKTVV